MIRRPNPTNTLINTRHRLLRLLQLLATRLPKQIRLLQNLLRLEIAHANRLLPSVDVEARHDGVFSWSRRDSDFDLRVLFCEGREVVAEEGAVIYVLTVWFCWWSWFGLLWLLWARLN